VLAGVVPLTMLLGAQPAAAATADSGGADGSARAAAATFRTITVGDHGTRVRLTQRSVDRAVTGHYGFPTRDAVRHFQRHRGLKVTGTVNYWTWRALNRHWHREMHVYRAKYQRILSVARAQFGDPYVYGGSGPNAFDCSGYTMYVYRTAIGRSLPHLAGSQYRIGQHISRAKARPGDLVFFHSGGYIYHAAIWAGNGHIYHAPHSGTVVQKDPLWSNNVWFARFIKHP
jgi:cell wall-associated NlpC family hydrolase